MWIVTTPGTEKVRLDTRFVLDRRGNLKAFDVFKDQMEYKGQVRMNWRPYASEFLSHLALYNRMRRVGLDMPRAVFSGFLRWYLSNPDKDCILQPTTQLWNPKNINRHFPAIKGRPGVMLSTAPGITDSEVKVLSSLYCDDPEKKILTTIEPRVYKGVYALLLHYGDAISERVGDIPVDYYHSAREGTLHKTNVEVRTFQGAVRLKTHNKVYL